jgi:hypothetical protein
MSDVRTTAVHEAGHAVEAWLLRYEGISIDSVSVVRHADNAGTTAYTLDVTNHSWYGHALRSEPDAKAAAGRAMAKIALAGWLAQVLAIMPPGAEANPTQDNAKADSLLSASGCDETWEDLVDPVCADLLDNWHRVLAVRDALLERRELSGDEVRLLIRMANGWQPGMEGPQPVTVQSVDRVALAKSFPDQGIRPAMDRPPRRAHEHGANYRVRHPDRAEVIQHLKERHGLPLARAARWASRVRDVHAHHEAMHAAV